MPQGSLSEILRQVRFLSPLERVELLQVLKQLDSGPSPSLHSPAYGKFAHLPNSSEDFIRRKAEEIDLEDRRFRQ